MKSKITDEEKHEIAFKNRKWFHRRRIAYGAFFLMGLFTLLAIFLPIAGYGFEGYTSIVSLSIGAYATIVGAYMGSSSFGKDN